MVDRSLVLVITVMVFGLFLFECYKRAEKEWQTTKTIGNRIKIISLCGGLFGISLIVCIGGIKALMGFFVLAFGAVLMGLQQQLLDRFINNKNISEGMKKKIWFVLFILAIAVYCMGLCAIASVFPIDPSELANLP